MGKPNNKLLVLNETNVSRLDYVLSKLKIYTKTLVSLVDNDFHIEIQNVSGPDNHTYFRWDTPENATTVENVLIALCESLRHAKELYQLHVINRGCSEFDILPDRKTDPDDLGYCVFVYSEKRKEYILTAFIALREI